MKNVNVAVVGATGMVGRSFLSILEERDFPINNFYVMASKRSAGSKLTFKGKEYVIEELTEDSFKKDIDIALFSAGGEISKKFAPIAANDGVTVIDNSSAWRMVEGVPLVVPEVNGKAALNNKGIIANPNCSTIQAVVALSPLNKKYGIKRIVYSTYQSVSGAGQAGCLDLENGIKGLPNEKFPHQIAGNCIPHIDVFLENGYTKEEQKMVDETKKILEDHSIKITATTVRVPVYYAHSESINVEFRNPYELGELAELLENSKGIEVLDNPSKNEYPTPLLAGGRDEVFVGRLRRDFSVENGLNMWVVSDNIRKGAALNAIQIAEYLLKNM